MSGRLPEALMPELRAKWIRLAGAREVVEHAAAHLKTLEADYQQTLGVCLRFLNLDPATDWRVDLETGEISPAPPQPPQSPQAPTEARTNGSRTPAEAPLPG